MNITIKLSDQIRINNSTKDFIHFDVSDGKLNAFKLSNEITRYRNCFQQFRVLNIFKKELSNKTINI